MKNTLTALAIATLGGIIAATISFLMMRPGVTVSPDGWAYWEGSVSIIYGEGYQYFGGQPITAFPPLFSSALAALQSATGIRGFSLKLLVTSLAGANGFLWTYLYSKLTADTRTTTLVFGMLFASLFTGAYFNALLSETLAMPLMALSLIFLLETAKTANIAHKILNYSALSATITLLLLTKNSNVALISAYFLVIAILANENFSKKVFLASITSVAPLLTWHQTRAALGQTESHPASLGGHYSALEYVQQLTNGISYLIGPSYIGIGLSCFVGALCLMALSKYSTRSIAGALFVYTAISTLTLFALFNLTWIHDTLEGRFVWHLPLLLVGIIVASMTPDSSEKVKFASLAALAAMTAIQGYRTANHVQHRLLSDTGGGIQVFHSIRPNYTEGPPVENESHILIAPPDYPWVDRQYDSAREPPHFNRIPKAPQNR